MNTKTYLIMGGVAVVFLFLLIRIVFVAQKDHEKEQEWFARNLRYEFSATVDSVKLFNATTGRLYARITAGDPHTYREDSLLNSLTKHGKLQFISRHRQDSIRFILFNANQVIKGDSVTVSSSSDTVVIFRSGEKITSISLSSALTGWGKPPVGN